jgi:hypothetical protein
MSGERAEVDAAMVLFGELARTDLPEIPSGAEPGVPGRRPPRLWPR